MSNRPESDRRFRRTERFAWAIFAITLLSVASIASVGAYALVNIVTYPEAGAGFEDAR